MEMQTSSQPLPSLNTLVMMKMVIISTMMKMMIGCKQPTNLPFLQTMDDDYGVDGDGDGGEDGAGDGVVKVGDEDVDEDGANNQSIPTPPLPVDYTMNPLYCDRLPFVEFSDE